MRGRSPPAWLPVGLLVQCHQAGSQTRRQAADSRPTRQAWCQPDRQRHAVSWIGCQRRTMQGQRPRAWHGFQTGMTGGQALSGDWVAGNVATTSPIAVKRQARHRSPARPPLCLCTCGHPLHPRAAGDAWMLGPVGIHPLSVLATSCHLTLGPGDRALAQRVSLPGPSASLCQEQNATAPDIPAWSPNVVLIWPNPVCLP